MMDNNLLYTDNWYSDSDINVDSRINHKITQTQTNKQTKQKTTTFYCFNLRSLNYSYYSIVICKPLSKVLNFCFGFGAIGSSRCPTHKNFALILKHWYTCIRCHLCLTLNHSNNTLVEIYSTVCLLHSLKYMHVI